MKKKKLKSLVESARKTVRNDIKRSLITELTSIAVKLGQDSKKLNKEIEKGSKELAKKLSKDIRIDKAAIIEVTELIDAQKVPVTEATPAN